MPDEPLPVRSKIGFERGYDRREHAADAFARGKRIDCGIIRHFLIVPSSFELFERQWAERASFHHPRQHADISATVTLSWGPQI